MRTLPDLIVSEGVGTMDGMLLNELRFFRVGTEPPSGRRFFAVAWFLPCSLRETRHMGLLLVIEEYTSRWSQWEIDLPREHAGKSFPEELLRQVVEDHMRAEYLDTGSGAVAEKASVEDLIMLAQRGWAKKPLALAARAAGGVQALDQLAREAMRAGSVESKPMASSEREQQMARSRLSEPAVVL